MSKYFYRFFLTIMVFTMLGIGFVSCGSDDDDDNIAIDNYIIGTWRSFKGVLYANGESKTVEITKTGENSAVYFECVFQKGNHAIFRGWAVDKNGLSHWVEDSCTYSINNNVINIIDSDNEMISMTFEPNDRTLFIRSTTINEGIQITTFIYFRK